jgi:hypothetical protein
MHNEGLVPEEATVRLFRTVQSEGEREVTREVECYNLETGDAKGQAFISQEVHSVILGELEDCYLSHHFIFLAR